MMSLNEYLDRLKRPHIMMAGLLTIITLIVITQHFNNPISDRKPSSFDVSVSNPHYKWTDAEGTLRGEITAESTQYDSKTTIIQMKLPQLITQDKNQQQWQVNARFGKSLQHNKVIHLWNHVVVKQTVNDGDPPTIITTQSLTILPYQAKAYTNEQVTLIQKNNKIESKGITIDMNKGVIHLLSNARGQYVPD